MDLFKVQVKKEKGVGEVFEKDDFSVVDVCFC